MTIEERITQYLVDKGMFAEQAKEVLVALKADEVNESMLHRWEDEERAYTPGMILILAIQADRAALRWIDSNLPQAWYRPLFAERLRGEVKG